MTTTAPPPGRATTPRPGRAPRHAATRAPRHAATRARREPGRGRPGRTQPGARDRRVAAEVERGSVSLELAILFPAVLLLVFAIVQYGLWFHARSLALTAAQEGVTAATTYTANPAAGPARAREFLDTHAGDLLTDVTITTDGTSTTEVRVQVTGRSLSLLPGTPGPAVSQAAQAGVERFTTVEAP